MDNEPHKQQNEADRSLLRSESELTNLLDAVKQGVANSDATEALFPLLYEELHRLAAWHMQSERGNHTLQATALVHEAWIRLVANEFSANEHPISRDHFMAQASVVMRHILINHAKMRNAEKRGGKWAQLALDEVVKEFEDHSLDLLALHEAIERLSQLDPTQSRLIEMKFFGGMNMQQCAAVLGVSERTAYQEWAHARAWLRVQLVGGNLHSSS